MTKWYFGERIGNVKKLNKFYNLLDQAAILSAQYSGGYSNSFFSAEEFHQALTESIIQLKLGDISQINMLYSWFGPTCDWDNFVGMEGLHLGDSIFELLLDLNKSSDISK